MGEALGGIPIGHINCHLKEWKMEIDRETYIRMKEKYSQWASWAIWNSNDIYDLSPLSLYPSKHWPYRNDIIFVGLNASQPMSTPWHNYHFKHRGGRDSFLESALNNKRFGGAYMTDLIKGSTPDSSSIISQFQRCNTFKHEQIENFNEEIATLQSSHPMSFTIGILGGTAFSLFHEFFIQDCPALRGAHIIPFPHHSAHGITKAGYVDMVANAYNEAIGKRLNARH